MPPEREVFPGSLFKLNPVSKPTEKPDETESQRSQPSAELHPAASPGDVRGMIDHLAARSERNAEEHRVVIEKRLQEGLAALRTDLQTAAAKAPEDNSAQDVAKQLADHVRIYTEDFHRWQTANRRPVRRLAIAGIALSAPAFLVLGILLQHQFEIHPLPDSSRGWKDHIWNNYGREIMECARTAKRNDRAEKCELSIALPK